MASLSNMRQYLEKERYFNLILLQLYTDVVKLAIKFNLLSRDHNNFTAIIDCENI